MSSELLLSEVLFPSHPSHFCLMTNTLLLTLKPLGSPHTDPLLPTVGGAERPG